MRELLTVRHAPTGHEYCHGGRNGTLCGEQATMVLEVDTGCCVAVTALCAMHSAMLGRLVADPELWGRPNQWAALVHLEAIYREVLGDVPGVARPNFLRAYARAPYGDPPDDLRGQLAAIARQHP